MITVVPLELWHLKILGVADFAAKLGNGYAWVMLRDEVPIAAGGVTIPHERVGIVWTCLDHCKGSAFLMRRVHYAARILFEQLKTQLDRIEAQTCADDRRACQWPRRFGFHYEGRMRRYYNDKTYLRFAWVRD